MRPFLTASLTVCLCLGWSAFQLSSPAQEASQNQNPFAGKVLMVLQKGADETHTTIEDVTIESVGTDQFLVGTHADTQQEGEWRAGLKMWVAMSDVQMIVEFSSLADFKSRLN